jgi:hypothetical protein
MSRLFRRLKVRPVRAGRDVRHLRARLMLQPLERRVAPATFTVTSVADAGIGSLRQAIANANAITGLDDIVFDPAVFGTQRTISLTSNELLIEDSVNLAGPGAGLLTIRRDPAAADFRILDFNVPSLRAPSTVSGVTIQAGRAALGGSFTEMNAGSRTEFQR